MEDRKLTLYTYPHVFSGFQLARDKKDKVIGILFSWYAETEVANILWLNLYCISWKRPFIRHERCFANKE